MQGQHILPTIMQVRVAPLGFGGEVCGSFGGSNVTSSG